jgi:hypothetical protein
VVQVKKTVVAVPLLVGFLILVAVVVAVLIHHLRL